MQSRIGLWNEEIAVKGVVQVLRVQGPLSPVTLSERSARPKTPVPRVTATAEML